jgi:hypothetical protein
MYIANLCPNVSFVLKRRLQLFSSRGCKTSSRGYKSTFISQVRMQNRATGTARAERRGWDGPTGPCACNGAGRTARETEWDGMNLPRVELPPDTTSCPDVRAQGISTLGDFATLFVDRIVTKPILKTNPIHNNENKP